MNTHDQQWIRDAGVILLGTAQRELDLSEMRFRFQTQQFDEESPNTCKMRIYNLSKTTESLIRKEYSRIMVKAGYKNGNSGIIFSGEIRQFQMGREDAASRFLDILASDGDVFYNFGITNLSVAAGTPRSEVLKKLTTQSSQPMVLDPNYPTILNGTELIRGKTMFGMTRDYIRDTAATANASWSIQNGRLQMIELTGYLPGQAVVLNSFSGMVGIPELTEEGVRVRALLNPNFRVGGLVKINNDEINKIVQQDPQDPRRFDSWKDIQHLASLSADGLYRLYVVEHQGDTRGNEWYSDMICLAVNNGKVAPFGILDPAHP